MVITEQMLSPYMGNSRLLESIDYLTEDESGYPAAKVPVRENERFGYTIALEDINEFCESNGINDMGYAVQQICNSSGINPSDVVFSVNEDSVIADNETADFVLDIMQEGVPVVVSPISKNSIEYLMADEAVDYYMQTGDGYLLEALANDDIYSFFNENSVEKQIKKTVTSNLEKKVNQGLDKGFSFHNAPELPPLSSQNKKTNNTNNVLLRGEGPQPIVTGSTSPKSKQPEAPKPPVNNQAPTQQQQQKPANNTQQQSQQKPTPAPAPTAGDPPKAENSEETGIFNAAKNAVKKGREHVVKLIASLNTKLKEWKDKGQAQDAGRFAKLRGYVSKIISYLTEKLHSFVEPSNK